MKSLLKIISYCGLALTLLPCFLLFAGFITIDLSKNLMLAGAALWFGTAIFWIKKDDKSLE